MIAFVIPFAGESSEAQPWDE